MIGLNDRYEVLIVSHKEENLKKLGTYLNNAMFEAPHTAKNVQEARRKLLHSSYDLIIIDSEPPGLLGTELAYDIIESFNVSVILLCPCDNYDELMYEAGNQGICVIAKPYLAETLEMGINLSISVRKRVLTIEEENRRLRSKIEELRLVNRAKWALHENLGLDEPTAHRYIEKTAMDNRITRLSLAKKILKEYE